MTRNIGDLQENEKQLLAKLIGKALPQHVIQICISLVEDGDASDNVDIRSAYNLMDDVAKSEGWLDPSMDAYDKLDPRRTS